MEAVSPRAPHAERAAFWALRDVTLEVARGASLGVIGRNGAGKSTLFKLLAGITAPTRGRIVINGRLAALIEVGSGFHPELTGRENVFLSGSHPRHAAARDREQARPASSSSPASQRVHRHAGQVVLVGDVRPARLRHRRAPRAGHPAGRRGARRGRRGVPGEVPAAHSGAEGAGHDEPVHLARPDGYRAALRHARCCWRAARSLEPGHRATSWPSYHRRIIAEANAPGGPPTAAITTGIALTNITMHDPDAPRPCRFRQRRSARRLAAIRCDQAARIDVEFELRLLLARTARPASRRRAPASTASACSSTAGRHGGVHVRLAAARARRLLRRRVGARPDARARRWRGGMARRDSTWAAEPVTDARLHIPHAWRHVQAVAVEPPPPPASVLSSPTG